MTAPGKPLDRPILGCGKRSVGLLPGASFRSASAALLGEASDLRELARFADFVPHLHLRHGDKYLLAPCGGEVAVVARLVEPRSGRSLVVLTDEACLQFYTGAYLDGSFTGRSGVPYAAHHGICLECQGYPDGVAHPEFGDLMVRPGQSRRRTTIYAFGVVPA